MRRRSAGKYETTAVAGEVVRAFVPAPLPPRPALELEGPVRGSLDRALLALGRLDGVSDLLPSKHLFLYSYVRKEAVLSSQIEGTQSTLSDLLLFEMKQAPGVPIDDVVEVSNYVHAMEHGLRRLREGFPLSNRLIREIHEILLSRGRGAGKSPGEFRRSQNWIGGSRPGNARFVPPPPQRVEGCMSSLEKFLHDRPQRTPAVLKAALVHVQFETVHPFLDGNGRVGRLLITLLLCSEDVLREPMLYLSLYLKQHRSRYYELLDAVRRDGEWEAWVEFFAEGVAETAEGAVVTARRLLDAAAGDAERISRLGREAGSAAVVHRMLQQVPVCNVPRLVKMSRLSVPTVNKAVDVLVRLKIVRELTGRKRDRVYGYEKYTKILTEGTQPL